jgi:hypothetical protein
LKVDAYRTREPPLAPSQRDGSTVLCSERRSIAGILPRHGWQGWFTLGVIVVLIAVLARHWVRPAVGVLGASVILLLAGVTTPEQASAGFSNEAPIVVGALLILARAVDLSGLMTPVVRGLFGNVQNRHAILASLLFPIAGLSAFSTTRPSWP